MFQNVFPSNPIKIHNCNNNLSRQVHSCPYCKCKSLDYARTQINNPLSPRNSLTSQFYQTNNLSILKPKDQQIQNVYYRTFDYPKRASISPPFNKKVVIHYSSPQAKQSHISSNNMIASFAQQKQINHHNINTSPIKKSPRTIYTDQNPPPKAKFLQKKIQRKKSQEKVQFLTPYKSLYFGESDKLEKPKTENSPKFYQPFQNILSIQFLKFDHNQDHPKQQPSQPINKQFLNEIPLTSTKNIIKKVSTPESVGSPFNSLIDSSPQIYPYGSFSSTPIIPNETSLKKKLSSSIKQITEFNEQQSEVKLDRKISQPAQIQKFLLTPKYFEMPYYQNQQKYEKFDKTLGKTKLNRQFSSQNQLIYSQSDFKTLQNHGGSQKHLFDQKYFKPDQKEIKSQQNMRPNTENGNFEKKKSKFQMVEISDNLQTPKSKFKSLRDGKLNESKSSIKFNIIGDHRKSRISIGSKQSINQVDIQRKISVQQQQKQEEYKFSRKESIQISEGEGQRKQLKEDSLIKSKQFYHDDSMTEQCKIINQQAEIKSVKSRQEASLDLNGDSLKVSKEFAGELSQQLKLNYDYYVLKPEKYSLNSDHKDLIKTKSPDTFNDSSLSSYGPVNISF